MKQTMSLALVMIALSTAVHAEVTKSIEHNTCEVGEIDVRWGYYPSSLENMNEQRENIINIIERKGYKVDSKFRDDFISGKEISSEISKDRSHKRVDLRLGFDLGGRTQYQRSSDGSLLTKIGNGLEDASLYVVESFENILSETYAFVQARGIENTTERISRKIYPTLVNPGNDEDIVESKKEVKEQIKELKGEISLAEKTLSLERELQKEFQKTKHNKKKIVQLNEKLEKLGASTFEIEGLDADEAKEVVADLDTKIKEDSLSVLGLKTELTSHSVEKATYDAMDKYFFAWNEEKEEFTVTSDIRTIFQDSKSFRRKSLAKDPKMLLQSAEMLPTCVVNADIDLNQKTTQNKSFNPFGRKYKME